MPPTVGIAIGFITSEPRPVDKRMGIRAIIVVATVIRQGRIRFRHASTVASRTSSIELIFRFLNV